MIVSFIDANRDEFGVEPICRVLQVAPSTYYAAKRREVEPSVRAVRDAVMMGVLLALWIENRKVYGAHKLWKAARRAGHDIGRDATARLMRLMAIEGVSRRRRKVLTTRADPAMVDRSQPTVSHHRTQLVRAGLLDREQRGKWAWFRVRPEGFAAIRVAVGETPTALAG